VIVLKKKLLTYKYVCEPIAGTKDDWYWYKVLAKSKEEADQMAADNNPYCKIIYYGWYE
jgi:hypothetical protein